MKEDKADADNRFSNCAAEIEIIRRRKVECEKNREDALRKMKDLGILEADMTTQFDNVRRKELEAQWKESLIQSKKFTNINRNAFDQHVRSSAELEDLLRKHEGLQEAENVSYWSVFLHLNFFCLGN